MKDAEILKAMQDHVVATGVASVNGSVVTWLDTGSTTPCDNEQQATFTAFNYTARRFPPKTELYQAVDAMLTSQALRTCIRAFLGHVTAVAHKRLNAKTRLNCVFLEKFARLQFEDFKAPNWNREAMRAWTPGSVYCFVALEAFTSRSLGYVKAGDIMYPASFKRPARHARGNVMDPKSWTCAGEYGVAALR